MTKTITRNGLLRTAIIGIDYDEGDGATTYRAVTLSIGGYMNQRFKEFIFKDGISIYDDYQAALDKCTELKINPDLIMCSSSVNHFGMDGGNIDNKPKKKHKSSGDSTQVSVLEKQKETVSIDILSPPNDKKELEEYLESIEVVVDSVLPPGAKFISKKIVPRVAHCLEVTYEIE